MKIILFTAMLMSLSLNAFALRGESDPCMGPIYTCGGSVIPDMPKIVLDANGTPRMAEQNWGGNLTKEIDALSARNVTDREVAKAVICAETGGYCLGGLSVPGTFSSKRTGYDYEKDILTAALSLEGRWDREERARIQSALEIIVNYMQENNLR